MSATAAAEPVAGEVPVAPRSTRLRQTAVGRTIVALAGAMLFASWLLGAPTGLYAAAFVALLAVVPLLTLLHARGTRLGAPPPVTAFAGESFPIDLPLSNAGHLLALRDVVVLHETERSGVERPAGYAATVMPGARTTVETVQRLLRRGRHESLTVAVESSFPLGLLTCRMEFVLACDVLVLPRLGSFRNLGALTAHRHGMLFQGVSDRGDEQEFHGMREWREGESLRRVSWRHSARRGRLLVREFRGEDRPPVHVVLDARVRPRKRAKTRRGSFERAVSLAATLVEQHLRRAHLVRFTILGGETITFERRRGRAALFPILEALAVVEPVTLEGERTISLATRRDEVTLVVCAGGGADLQPDRGVRVLDVERRDVAERFVRARTSGSMVLLGRSG